MASIYARLILQKNFKHHILFSAGSCRVNDEDKRSDETQLIFYLNICHNLTEKLLIKLT